MKIEIDVPQYFVDDELIAKQRGIHRRWESASFLADPILVPDQPWERPTIAFSSVVRAGSEYRMYYGEFDGFRKDATGHHNSQLLLALSDDGLLWRKPELDLYPWHGRQTNIVLTSSEYFDSPSIVACPDGTYRLLQFELPSVSDAHDDRSDWGLHGYTSVDGFVWEKIPGRRIPALDRNTLLRTTTGLFVSYNRHQRMFEEVGARAIFRSTSDDFVEWTDPELVLAPDPDDEADVEFYGMPVFERHGRFWGLLEVWRRDVDRFEIELVHSRDGVKWSRSLLRRPFIRGDQDWNNKWVTAAGSAPIEVGDQLVFYVNGRNVAHGWSAARMHGVIGIATLPVDRFCAIEGDAGGVFETPSFVFEGSSLHLNADTRSRPESHPFRLDGRITIEVLDSNGAAVPDFSGASAGVFLGNTYARGLRQPDEVQFAHGSLSGFRGQTIRLRFTLERSRLYTFTVTA